MYFKKRAPDSNPDSNTGLAFLKTPRSTAGWGSAFVLAFLILFFVAVAQAFPVLRPAIFGNFFPGAAVIYFIYGQSATR